MAAAVIIAAPAILQAQQSPAPTVNPVSPDDSRPTLRALRVTDAPVIDGRLADEAWAHAPVADHFRQRDPDEGEPATERTEIRVLYDEDALYVGARLYDSEPSAISTRLSSRDGPPDADTITVLLDPRHDHRTGVQFIVTAAGVQGDGVISNDTFTDASWDAVEDFRRARPALEVLPKEVVEAIRRYRGQRGPQKGLMPADRDARPAPSGRQRGAVRRLADGALRPEKTARNRREAHDARLAAISEGLSRCDAHN